MHDQNHVASPPDLVLPFYLSDLWRGARRFWWVLLLLLVLSIAGSALCGLLTAKHTASATVTVLIENPFTAKEDYEYAYNWSTATQLADALTYILSSDRLEQAICAQLSCPEMPAALSVDFTADTNLLTLQASGDDPHSSLAVLEAALDLCPSISEPVLGHTRFVVLSTPALLNDRQKLWGQALLWGTLLGLFLSVVWLVLYAVLRDTIRTNHDIQQYLDLPCLGILPNPAQDAPGYDRAIRQLQKVICRKSDSSHRVMILAGTTSSDDVSVLARTLARAHAEAGQRVLLLDEPLHTAGIADTSRFLQPLRAQYDRIILCAPPAAAAPTPCCGPLLRTLSSMWSGRIRHRRPASERA